MKGASKLINCIQRGKFLKSFRVQCSWYNLSRPSCLHCDKLGFGSALLCKSQPSSTRSTQFRLMWYESICPGASSLREPVYCRTTQGLTAHEPDTVVMSCSGGVSSSYCNIMRIDMYANFTACPWTRVSLATARNHNE